MPEETRVYRLPPPAIISYNQSAISLASSGTEAYDEDMEIRLTPEQEELIRRYMASLGCRTPEAEQPEKPSLLLQWLHETAGPRIGLKELRRRLGGKVSGTMAQTVHEERNARV